MKSGLIAAWIALGVVASSCGDAAGGASSPPASRPVFDGEFVSGPGHQMTAPVVNNAGHRIGKVTVWPARRGLLFKIRVAGLEPGGHGLHLHAVGVCDDAATFRRAGGHLFEGRRSHGFLHPDGPHPGDLPNLFAASDGYANADVFTTLIGPDALIDEDGAALVIHEKRDDYRTRPTGNSGRRIACAAFPGKRRRPEE